MAWKQLQINDLRLILSEKETQQLNEYSLNEEITDVINSTMDLVADAWRGALRAKGTTLDSRQHYVPEEYAYYVLVHCRHAVWTRFPNSRDIALDERRKEEYDEAMKLLKNPILDVEAPTGEGVDPDAETATGTGAGSIRVPLNRINQWYTDSTRQDIELGSYL